VYLFIDFKPKQTLVHPVRTIQELLRSPHTGWRGYC